ncbi:MAG: M48 family metalloprotease [Planctomycetes bacterium]|nr:M48 family metalloprotease [Planctomycetota bacterium]
MELRDVPVTLEATGTFGRFVLLALAALALASCGAKDTLDDVLCIEDITPKHEYFIGRSALVDILARVPESETKPTEIHESEELQRYVNMLGNYLAANQPPPYRPTELGEDASGMWYFLVVDSQEINAFALPGGFIVITSGMLRSLENEDELAFVLGHEITHVTLRHALDELESSSYVSMLWELPLTAAQMTVELPVVSDVTGAVSDTVDAIPVVREVKIAKDVFNLFTGFVEGVASAVATGLPAEKEFEADVEGLKIIRDAGIRDDEPFGYRPHSGLDYLKRIEELSKSREGYIDFLGFGHGDYEARVDNLREFIEDDERTSTVEREINPVGMQRFLYHRGLLTD